MVAQNFYTLGLDIGMASVGAAVLGQDHIGALYVRAFDKAEQPKNGESLNVTRRLARSVRRRLRRRVFRLLRLRRLLKRHGVLPDQNLPACPISPWELRAVALGRYLAPAEFACVLYHLIKHRGFQSTRKSELKSDEKLGQMLSGVALNRQLLEESNMRTVGELACKHEAFQGAKRNKAGSYQHTFARTDVLDEMRKIFEAQRDLQNDLACEELQRECEKLLMARRPALSGAALLKMVGTCVFEKQQPRAPKASFRAEQFVWLTKLNNLRIVRIGSKRELDAVERNLALALPFQTKTAKLTYKELRKILGLSEHERFAGLVYRTDNKNPEDATLFEAKGFHAIRKIFDKANQKELWQRIQLEPDRLDELGYALTCFKEDQESRTFLQQKGYDSVLIEEALEVSFSEFIRLSQAALIKILPFMHAGQRYDEAVQSAGYAHHSDLTAISPKHRLLPHISKTDFPNPVVYRALNQARKLLNAIIREHGAPGAIHIELARDLARSFDERKKIERAQLDFQKEKKDAAEKFLQTFGREPNAKHQDLLKIRLYHEQDAQCAYSQKPLDIYRLFDDGYAEIDHALPYSRSWDNSQNNKVLVLTEENRNKCNCTPYEYLDGKNDSQRWRQFLAWVMANKKIRQAKRQRLLRTSFGPEDSNEFLQRNLNDTRYICRAFKNLLETHLQLASNTPDKPESWRCMVISGQLTADLRHQWGLRKVREDGDLHHAMDAAVIAACSFGMVKRMADYARAGELRAVKNGYVDPETGEIRQARREKPEFPQPWPHFRKELLARLSDDPAQALSQVPAVAARLLPDELAAIKPIHVSRAPLRRSGGEAHQETIRSCKAPAGKSAVKTPLTSLKLKDLENIVGFDNPRNAAMIEAIAQRLQEHGNDGKKAFATPLYKPSADDKVAPQIRSVKLLSTQVSGLPVRDGIANNGSMLRVDIFTKNKQFFAIPLYVSDKVKVTLPQHAVVPGKAEKDWLLVDDSYQFCFSLYPNDWVCVRYGKDKPAKEGYFSGLDRATASISLWVHDRDQKVGEKGLLRGIGIKTVQAIEKYHVDVLGRVYPARNETRQPLRRGKV